MATKLSLRIKSKSGQNVISDLTYQDKISKLKDKLETLTGIPAKALHLLNGFPPKALNLSNEDATIKDSGIHSGDTIIVEEKCNLTNEEVDLKKYARTHIADEENFSDRPGILMKMVVPADNSCLFTSVGYCLNGKVDPSCAGFMREIITNSIEANPEEYSEAILGKSSAEYCKWILKPTTWGGAIELSILSQFYGLEIAVIDCINAIINRFGEDRGYSQRIFLIFDGIHYDPLYLEPINGGSIQTLFPTSDKRILLEAEELAREARNCRLFTDCNSFILKCMTCNVILSGQIAAQQHANSTGHNNFGEINTPNGEKN